MPFIFSINLKEVWHYRDLLLMLVKRDYVTFYKQTILGPLWFFIQPFFTTIIYTFIFGGLANLSTDNLPQPLFYMAGITAWNYFSDCITKTSTVFKDNANIFGKVYFPRIIIPLVPILAKLVDFGVALLVLAGMLIYYYYTKPGSIEISMNIIALPFLIVMLV